MILHSVRPAHPHSSTFYYSSGQIIRQYTYDDNGSMTQRVEGSDTYTFGYDQENRLVSGAKNSVTLATYVYDGSGVRVKAAEGTLTTVYIGDYYEWRSDSTVTTQVKYYYANGQRIAMRTNGALTWLLGDHLGSTAITATENGTLATEQTYTAWGQTRSGAVTTDRQYTGQINEAQLGIYFYNARYYDPYFARFIQADSIIPNAGNPLAWDRYSYTYNDPVNHTDPTGNDTCDEEGNCYNNHGWYAAAGVHFGVTITWKKMIKTNFGITMSDAGDKKWNTANLHLMYGSLSNVNHALNGYLRSMVAGATFKWMEYDGDFQYFATTHTNGMTGVDFQTIGTQTIRQMNIYHEVGHLLDNVPGTKDEFTNSISRLENPSWVTNDNYVDSNVLISARVYDPNYATADAIQASEAKNWEVWADAFANYVAGNINLNAPAGMEMYNFVANMLSP